MCAISESTCQRIWRHQTSDSKNKNGQRFDLTRISQTRENARKVDKRASNGAEMQQCIVVDEVIKLAEKGLVFKSPSEEEVLEADNLSQQQALDNDFGLICQLKNQTFGQQQEYYKDEFDSCMDV